MSDFGGIDLSILSLWVRCVSNPTKALGYLQSSLASDDERLAKAFGLIIVSAIIGAILSLPVYILHGIEVDIEKALKGLVIPLVYGIFISFALHWSLKIFGVPSSLSHTMLLQSVIYCYSPFVLWLVRATQIRILAVAPMANVEIRETPFTKIPALSVVGFETLMTAPFVSWRGILCGSVGSLMLIILYTLLALRLSDLYSVPKEKAFRVVALYSTVIVPGTLLLAYFLVA